MTNTGIKDNSDIQEDDLKGFTGISELEGKMIVQGEAITKHDEKIQELNKIVSEFKNDTAKIKEELEKKFNTEIERKENMLREKIDESKVRLIETLGIFVALFTFISVDFQVFRSYNSPLAISGLILILLGSLMMFVWLLDYLVFSKKRKINTEIVLINLAILVMGFFMFIISSK